MCVGLVSYERLHLSCASHSCIITKQIAKKVGMHWRTAKVCNQATGRKMGGDGVEGWVEDLIVSFQTLSLQKCNGEERQV